MAGEITLETKGLIQADGTFCLQPSDFADLSLFIEAVLSSNLANDAIEAYGRFGSGSITLASGRVVSQDYLFLDILNSYNSSRAFSGNLYETTSPMIAMLCTKIAAYATSATTVYADLFTQFRAYSSSPTHDGPRTLIVNTVNNLVTEVGFLIDLSTSIFTEFKKFEEGVTKNQSVLSDRLAILKDVEKYFQQDVSKLTRAADKKFHADRLKESMVVDSDISKIVLRWQPALTGLQLLIGAWSAIKGDLESVKRIVQNEALFESGKRLLDLNQSKITKQWQDLGVEAARYTGRGRSFLIRS